MKSDKSEVVEYDISIRRETPPIGEGSKYYSAVAHCGNCSTRNHAYILKGRPRKGISITCDNCGCPVPL